MGGQNGRVGKKAGGGLRIGLFVKFILTSSLVIAVVAASLGFVFVRILRREMHRNLVKRGQVLALHFAGEVAHAWGREYEIRKLLDTALAQEDVIFVQRLDAQGRLRQRVGVAAGVFKAIPAPDSRLLVPVVSHGMTLDGVSRVVDVLYPITEMQFPLEKGTHLLGFLRFGISTDRLEASVRRVTGTTILVASLVAFFAILGIVLAARRIVDPILSLVRAARDLSRGDLSLTSTSSASIAVPSGDEVGELTRVFEVMVKRLRQSRAELEALWEARERSKLEHVVESMGDAVVVVDLDERVILANRKARAIMEPSFTETLPLSEQRLGRHRTGKWIRPVLLGRETLVQERVEAGGREGRTFDIRVVPMRGVDDELLGAIAVTRDVTAEIEMARQLVQSEKLAAIGQLAAGVAHEVNNPLAVIYGFAQLLETRVEGDRERTMVEKILVQSRRCRDIVKSLSRFSRVSGGTRGPCQVGKIVQETVKLLGAQLRGADIAVELSLAEDLPPVQGNESEIQQVVFNLLNNGRDAMPDGGRLHLTSRAEDGGVSLEIRDEGRGIPDHLLSKIFEPFFTTKDPGQGTGLGLAVCQTIVQSHEGRITVRSRDGEGTSFVIWLPGARLEAPPGPSSDTVSERSLSLNPPLALVVDDEEDILSYCSRLFEELGCGVLTCGSAEAVWEAVRGQRFGLFLIDVRMPRMNGVELLQRLRETHPDVPALFMTGLLDVDPAGLAQGRDLGSWRLIQKPFSIDRFIEVARDLVSRSRPS